MIRRITLTGGTLEDRHHHGARVTRRRGNLQTGGTQPVDCFAPALGNAHGQYKQAPKLNAQRVSDLVAATGVPMALHGGTGLADEQFTDLIARGCAKVNISTALKESYLRSTLASLQIAAERDKWDPPTLEGVGEDILEQIFAALPSAEEWTPLP